MDREVETAIRKADRAGMTPGQCVALTGATIGEVRAVLGLPDEDDEAGLPGVPDGAELEDRARVYEPIAVETLARIAQDKKQPAAARVSAANSILDRSRGKPQQEVRHSVDGSGLLAMLDDMREVRRRLYEDVEDVVLIPQSVD